MSDIKSLPQDKIDEALMLLSKKYRSLDLTPGITRKVLSECISSLGGLFAQATAEGDKREWWFFRVRTKSSFSHEEDMLDPKQYTYLPKEMCINKGRCHIPGYPVFYGSDSYDCAIQEMKQPDENEYLLSIWRLPVCKKIRLNFLCGSNIKGDRLIKNKMMILRDACLQHKLTDSLNSGRIISHIVAWSDLFMSPDHSISSSIAHQVLYGDFAKGKDLIAYGSALNGGYVNFALPTNLADELEIYKIFKIKHSHEKNETTWLESADMILNSGWKKAEPNDLPHMDPLIPTGYQAIGPQNV
ncbi:MAG: hypothetical protein V7682_10805 [Cycloclasticus sp.]